MSLPYCITGLIENIVKGDKVFPLDILLLDKDRSIRGDRLYLVQE